MIEGLKPYVEYKESHPYWVGSIPRHWVALPNRAIFAEVKDRDHSDEQMLSVTINRGIVQQESLLKDSSKKDGSRQDKSTYKLVQPGDIAYNKMRAWQGAIAVSEFRGIISPAYVVMRLRKQLNSRYFHYLYRTPLFAKEAERWSYGITSDMWSLRPEHFKMIYSVLPPRDEQDAIVRFLDYANGRIERAIQAKKKLIALVNEQKQAIIHRAVTRGLNPDVPLKPSGIPWLGDIPRHWEMRRLKDLSPRISGRLVYQPAQYFTERGVPFLMGNNVTPEGIVWDDVKRIPKEVNARFAQHALRVGDVITVRVGAPGVTCVVPNEADGLNCGSLMIIRQGSKFDSHWLSHVMNSFIVRTQIALVQYGAAQEQINIGDAVNFFVPVPQKAEQRLLVKYIHDETQKLYAAFARAQREIGLLREYRTRLTADVVTGKFDVREVARQLPASIEEIPVAIDDEELEEEAVA